MPADLGGRRGGHLRASIGQAGRPWPPARAWTPTTAVAERPSPRSPARRRRHSRRAGRPDPRSWSASAARPAPASRRRSWTPARPGTASMNASSTTSSRPGRTSARISAAGCSTPVGLVGLPIMTRSASAGIRSGSRPKPSLGGQHHPVGLVAGGVQRGLRLGELRVHDHRLPGSQGPGQQGEGLGAARRRQHLVGRQPVGGGDRRHGLVGARIAGQPSDRVGDHRREPRRRGRDPHVDREVDQAVGEVASPWWCRSCTGHRSARLVASVRVVLAGGAGDSACTASANRWASCGCPAQWVCR